MNEPCGTNATRWYPGFPAAVCVATALATRRQCRYRVTRDARLGWWVVREADLLEVTE